MSREKSCLLVIPWNWRFDSPLPFHTALNSNLKSTQSQPILRALSPRTCFSSSCETYTERVKTEKQQKVRGTHRSLSHIDRWQVNPEAILFRQGAYCWTGNEEYSISDTGSWKRTFIFSVKSLKSLMGIIFSLISGNFMPWGLGWALIVERNWSKFWLCDVICLVGWLSIHSRTTPPPMISGWAAQAIISNFCFQKKNVLLFSNFFSPLKKFSHFHFFLWIFGCFMPSWVFQKKFHSKVRHNATKHSSFLMKWPKYVQMSGFLPKLCFFLTRLASEVVNVLVEKTFSTRFRFSFLLPEQTEKCFFFGWLSLSRFLHQRCNEDGGLNPAANFLSISVKWVIIKHCNTRLRIMCVNIYFPYYSASWGLI